MYNISINISCKTMRNNSKYILSTSKGMNIARWILNIAIFLLPYDAMHVMPSTYRPISVYFFLLFILFTIFSKDHRIRVNKPVVYLVLFTMYGIISSAFLTTLNTSRVSLYVDYLMSLLCGIITFFACHIGFDLIAKDKTIQQYIDEIFIILGRAYIIPLVVGIFDALAVYGVLPYSVKLFIKTIFGGNVTQRMSITTFEAAWASEHMLFAFAVFLYLSKRFHSKRYKLECGLSLLLFIACASLKGIAVLSLGLFIWGIYSNYVKGSIKKSFLTIIKVCLGVFILFVIFYQLLLILPPSYFTKRVLEFVSFDHLLHTDGSAFIRIIYPYIALRMFLGHPLFGFGGGSFGYAVVDYIKQDYFWATGFQEVAGHIVTRSTASPISLYARVLGEHGLVGGWLFFSFLGLSLQKAKKMRLFADASYTLFFISICITFFIQFASYSLTLVWVALALVINVPDISKGSAT